ncbi:MAG: hypothetical protein GY705_03540, partial [Bacteroidetes bacterium]|nr:hypothetical protein [Bacteroidota bacterium]
MSCGGNPELPKSPDNPGTRYELFSGSSIESNTDEKDEVIEISSGDDDVFQNEGEVQKEKEPIETIVISSEEEDNDDIKVVGFHRGDQKPRVVILSSDSGEHADLHRIYKTKPAEDQNPSGELNKSDTKTNNFILKNTRSELYSNLLCENCAVNIHLINTADHSVIDPEVVEIMSPERTESDDDQAGDETAPNVANLPFAAYMTTQRLAKMPFSFFKEFYQDFCDRHYVPLEPQPLPVEPQPQGPGVDENEETSESAILEKSTFDLGSNFVDDSYEYQENQENRTPR